MAADSDYYDQSSPSEAEDMDKKSMDMDDIPDEKLALVSPGFFNKPGVEVGDREMVEVVKIYDGEVAIKCVYEGKEGEGKEEHEDEAQDRAMMESEDMMA